MLANAIEARDKIFFLEQCISKLETWVILFQKESQKAPIGQSSQYRMRVIAVTNRAVGPGHTTQLRYSL